MEGNKVNQVPLLAEELLIIGRDWERNKSVLLKSMAPGMLTMYQWIDADSKNTWAS